jgi:hypothetical protein
VIQLRDQFGKEVFTGVVGMNEETKVDLTEFSSGIYFLRYIAQDGSSYDKRISIEK